MASTIPQPMAPTTANWHWKNKTVTPWAKQWFDRELTAVRVNGEGTEEVGIERVVEVDGDVELGQRKSKCVSPWSPLRRAHACTHTVKNVLTRLVASAQVDHHLRLQSRP